MATFNRFQKTGYDIATKSAGKVWPLIAQEYKTAMIQIGADLDKVYARILAGVKPEDYYNTMLKYGRLDSLLKSTIKNYNEAAVHAGQLQINASRVSINNSYYLQQYATNFALSADTFTAMSNNVVKISVAGTPKVWADITKDAREKMTATFGNLNTYQPQYGTLTDVLTNNRNITAAKIKSIVNQGMIQGRSASQVARDLRKTFNTTINSAERIFITENHRNRALGDWANYNQSQSIGLELWREIVSTLDSRTRAQSAKVDGRLDKDGTGFRYPNGTKYLVPGSTGVPAYDIRDRERTIQVIPGEDGDELRRGRDPVKSANWEKATAAERKARKLSDGTQIYPRSEQTDVFSYGNFPEWAKSHGLRKNVYGELLPVN